MKPTLERLAEYFGAQGYSWSVTVVSDGSTDETDAIVREFSDSHTGFHLLSSQPNHGKGFVVRKGMLEVEGELLLFSDADLAAPIEEVEKLLPHIAEADIAIGSRPLKESKLEKHQPWYREMLGRSANLLIQLFAIRGIHDTQCGFKLFKNPVAKDVFSRCKLDGFSFDFESLMVAHDLGYKIAEVPIRWSHQEGSKVKLWRDVPKALFDLVRLRFMGRKRRLEKRAG